MAYSLLIFVIGLAILLIASEILVGLSIHFSRILRISPLIIGITVIALGTSLPELTVSTLSGLKGDLGLAFGNIIGSNIFNLILVFPLALLVKPLKVDSHQTQTNALIMLVATFIFVTLHFLHLPNIATSLILLTLAVITLFFDHQQGALDRLKHKQKPPIKDIVLLITSLIGIISGGLLVVNSIESLGIQTGISTTLLGLSITAIATSLPELITAIISEEKHQEKIALGSIIGSNTYNLLLIGGLISFFGTPTTIPVIDYLFLCLFTLTFVITLKYYHGRKVPRFIAFLFFSFCALYLLTLKR